MFGHKWQPGEGTVVETRVSRFGPGDNSSIVTHYVIDVRPNSGEPFRTEVREPVTAGAFHAPIVNEVVMLKCDPARKKLASTSPTGMGSLIARQPHCSLRSSRRKRTTGRSSDLIEAISWSSGGAAATSSGRPWAALWLGTRQL